MLSLFILHLFDYQSWTTCTYVAQNLMIWMMMASKWWTFSTKSVYIQVRCRYSDGTTISVSYHICVHTLLIGNMKLFTLYIFAVKTFYTKIKFIRTTRNLTTGAVVLWGPNRPQRHWGMARHPPQRLRKRWGNYLYNIHPKTSFKCW